MIDKHKEVEDLLSMHLWSGQDLPYQELIRMLKRESTSAASLYDIAMHVQSVMKDDTDDNS